MTAPLYTVTLRHRRRALAWWCAAVAATVALVTSSYVTVEGQDELDESLADLPAGVRALIGLEDGLTLSSPEGFLQSQLFANLLPLLLTILAIGLGSRLVAGDENRGYLSIVDTEPLHRRRWATQRLGVLAVSLATAGATAGAVLLASLGPSGLSDVSWSAAIAAVVGTTAIGAVHGAVAFGIGAGTGRSGLATALAAAYAAWGYLVLSLAELSDALRPLRRTSPWFWFNDASPIRTGWSEMGPALLLAAVVAATAVLLGLRRLDHRDLAD